MIDKGLDKRLQNFNTRYQEVLYSKELQTKKKKETYIDNISSFRIKRILDHIKYKEYARSHFSTSGNIDNDNNHYQDISNYSIAVYSCIVGPYDHLIDPVYAEAGVKYYVLTDQEIPQDTVWEKIDIKDEAESGHMSNLMLNRKYKILQNDLLKKFDYTVYVDGNIEIVAGISPLIENMGGCNIGVHYHPVRDCIYDEVVSVKHNKRLCNGDMNAQIDAYKKEGFPRHFGMYENCILIRDNRSPDALRLMELWWDEYCKHPTRDQLSLPYVIWKNGYDKSKIMILGNKVERNPRFNRINSHL